MLLYCATAPHQATRPCSRRDLIAASRWSPPTLSTYTSMPSGAAWASNSLTGPGDSRRRRRSPGAFQRCVEIPKRIHTFAHIGIYREVHVFHQGRVWAFSQSIEYGRKPNIWLLDPTQSGDLAFAALFLQRERLLINWRLVILHELDTAILHFYAYIRNIRNAAIVRHYNDSPPLLSELLE